MADDEHGQPSRTVIGANMGEDFAAIWAVVDGLEIGAEQRALSAIGTDAQGASPHGLIEVALARLSGARKRRRDVGNVSHTINIGAERLRRQCAIARATFLRNEGAGYENSR